MFLAKRSNSRMKNVIISLLVAVLLFVGINIGFKIVYPIDYTEYINKYSSEYKVDPYLVAAIINVESKYDVKAKSQKEARGLMQISSTTGQWASKELGFENFTLDCLYDPETNIRIGCWYINVLNEEFNGNLKLVLAAYNGGSGNVNKWLKDSQYSQDGENLNYIPFKETEDYVKNVLKNHSMYKKIHKNAFELGQNVLDSLLGNSIIILKRMLKQFLVNI